MKAVVVQEPGKATLNYIPEPSNSSGETLLRIRMIGLCGTDLNTFRGKNLLVSFPRVLGHEVAATILHACSGAIGRSPRRVSSDACAVHRLRSMRQPVAVAGPTPAPPTRRGRPT
jgi:D-arabinose 1-dehydrogenase-like Zn-dependent alcohol dehydrogenase